MIMYNTTEQEKSVEIISLMATVMGVECNKLLKGKGKVRSTKYKKIKKHLDYWSA